MTRLQRKVSLGCKEIQKEYCNIIRKERRRDVGACKL